MKVKKMKVKIKRTHPEAKIPTYAKYGDAAMDLYAVSRELDKYHNYVYNTGISLEIPDGYVGLVFPRSSVSKTPMTLRNSVGVIDSGYRGNIMLLFKKDDRIGLNHPNAYEVGDRVGQIMILPYPNVEFVEVDELTQTDRGTGGFGSTGDK
jgi:dUTP pyrophosphatase